MNPTPPIIEIHGDDVTVEASYLAARLGEEPLDAPFTAAPFGSRPRLDGCAASDSSSSARARTTRDRATPAPTAPAAAALPSTVPAMAPRIPPVCR